MRAKVILGSLLLLAPVPAMADCVLSAEAEGEVRAAAAEYVAAWRANDEARVMGLLHDEVVLTPPMGATPQVGKAAAREFWFPKDSPPFVITRFEQEVSAVTGCRDLAVVRGRQKALEWSQGDERYRNGGSNFVSVYRKGAGGRWLLLWQTWNTVGTEKIGGDSG